MIYIYIYIVYISIYLYIYISYAISYNILRFTPPPHNGSHWEYHKMVRIFYSQHHTLLLPPFKLVPIYNNYCESFHGRINSWYVTMLLVAVWNSCSGHVHHGYVLEEGWLPWSVLGYIIWPVSAKTPGNKLSAQFSTNEYGMCITYQGSLTKVK